MQKEVHQSERDIDLLKIMAAYGPFLPLNYESPISSTMQLIWYWLAGVYVWGKSGIQMWH